MKSEMSSFIFLGADRPESLPDIRSGQCERFDCR
jgi:hypothetical protein